MDLKKLLLLILSLQFSCTNGNLDATKNSESKSLKSLVKRETSADKEPSIFEFDHNDYTGKIKSNSYGVAAKFPKSNFKKKIKHYRIKKKLFTNSHTNSVSHKAVDKPITLGGKLLKIREEKNVNYELDMNKKFQQFAFNVESEIKEESLVALANSIDWTSPAKAEEEALLARKNEIANKAREKAIAENNIKSLNTVSLTEDELINNAINSMKKAETVEKNSDELVLIDLEEKEQISQKPDLTNAIAMAEVKDNEKVVSDAVSSIMSVATRSLSSSVTDVIARELKTNKRRRNKTKYKKLTAKRKTIPQIEELTSSFVADDSGCTTNGKKSRMAINTYAVDIGQKRLGPVHNFDFIPEYDKNEILADSGNGCIGLPVSTHKGSVIRGTFSSREGIHTKADIYVDGNSLQVPIVSRSSLTNFLDKNKDFDPGSFILVELAENIVSVEVAAKYGRKYFFNEFFQETETEDIQFVLFTGVTPGNVTIQYLTSDDHIVDRIAHVVTDEIYYDMARVDAPQRDNFYLFEDGIFSKNKKLLVDGSNIRFFNSDIYAKQKALNLYEVQVPQTARGMRKYFELAHLGEVIVMGRTDEDNVSLPTRRFIGQILSEMQIDDLMGRCLVQINTQKAVKDFHVSGEGQRGYMNIDYHYLDKDGNFGKFKSDSIKRVFVVGEDQGVINARLDYFDSESEFIQTYCSKETYLVEQL